MQSPPFIVIRPQVQFGLFKFVVFSTSTGQLMLVADDVGYHRHIVEGQPDVATVFGGGLMTVIGGKVKLSGTSEKYGPVDFSKFPELQMNVIPYVPPNLDIDCPPQLENFFD